MVRKIVTYPEQPSLEFGVNVRKFDEELFSLLEDLKDTIKENNLDGLAAFQIGSYYNVIVVKDENGEFLELINPSIIRHSDKTEEVESTAYFPGLSAKVPRYNDISVVYQDRNGEDKTLKAQGKLARVIQRKIDYTFGGNFLSKLSKEERERFEQKLNGDMGIAIGGACPTTFVRDKFMFAANIVTALMVVTFIVSFFVSDSVKETLWDIQLYSSFGVVALNAAYFLYGLYEGRIYKQCTSCQVGNFIGTVAISLAKLTVIMLLSYYFI